MAKITRTPSKATIAAKAAGEVTRLEIKVAQLSDRKDQVEERRKAAIEKYDQQCAKLDDQMTVVLNELKEARERHATARAEAGL